MNAQPLLPSHPPSVSIIGRAGHAFSVQTMMQGFACHLRGVELTRVNPALVRARVRSKRLHEVELRAAEGKLLTRCSCPAKTYGVEVCKHVWATLLEVDRQDALESLRQSRTLLTIAPLTTAAEPAPGPAGGKTTAKADGPKARPAKTKASAKEDAKEPAKEAAKPAKPPRKTRR